MAAATDSTYFIGQGKVRWALRQTAGGILTGFTAFGDVSDLQIDHAQKFVDVEENITGYGGTALHASVAIPINMKMTVTQWAMANIQKAVYGSWSGAASGGTVTGEVVQLYQGERSYLKNLGVSALTLTVGASPAVAGTDYNLDSKFGGIDVLTSSTLVPSGSAGASGTASYTWAANNGTVQALTASPQEVCLVFEGLNVANPDGAGSFQAVKVTLNRVSLDISKMLDLLGRKESTFELGGMILIDPTVTTAGLSQYYSIEKA